MLSNKEIKSSKSIFISRKGENFLFPFIIVTTLFFLWGFAHSILDVLNKHFQDSFSITKAQSGMIQAVVYGGYFLMALPAGFIISKWGYRIGVIIGLLLYGIGALLFIPAEGINTFNFFLLCLFIIGCGLTCLETAANPYVTVLGDENSGERRINISQSFNGLGWILGPLVGGMFVFGEGESNLSTPYAIIGALVLLVAIVFSRIKLPEIEDNLETNCECASNSLIRNSNFVLGVVALFAYVAAQTGINSFFINYVTDLNIGIDAKSASVILSFGGMGLFMLGRMLGSWIMQYIIPIKLLTICALGAIVSMVIVVANIGILSCIALFLCYLFESIMFPTIFSLSLRGAKGKRKLGSSILIMSIVGGAIAPYVMGSIADNYSMALAFVVPLSCFVIIYLFAGLLYKR
ncbi:MAG: sugar MFS transporter [Bacteroides sp.]|nr:sugar MFS transporter [Bacteroides sp.]